MKPSGINGTIRRVPQDIHFMGRALAAAEKALEQGEFPVGCVLTCENRVVATGARTGTGGGERNEVDHAEIRALRRLADAAPAADPRGLTLYTTMEPCLMCFGAILLYNIGRVVFAYEDVMGGGTRCDLRRLPPLYRSCRTVVTGAVRRRESLLLFKRFFSDPSNGYWRGSRLAEYTLAQKTDHLINH